MQSVKLVRKKAGVEGYYVTFYDAEKIAEWCGGIATLSPTGPSQSGEVVVPHVNGNKKAKFFDNILNGEHKNDFVYRDPNTNRFEVIHWQDLKTGWEKAKDIEDNFIDEAEFHKLTGFRPNLQQLEYFRTGRDTFTDRQQGKTTAVVARAVKLAQNGERAYILVPTAERRGCIAKLLDKQYPVLYGGLNGNYHWRTATPNGSVYIKIGDGKGLTENVLVDNE